MGTDFQERNWEPLIDAELEEWLLFKDEIRQEVNDPILISHESDALNGGSSDFEEIEVDKNWFEKFPLFDEIQPLEETEFQSLEEFQFFPDQNEIYLNPVEAVEDLMASSMESPKSFFFSEDNATLYIESNSEESELKRKNVEADKGNPDPEEEKMEMVTVDEVLRVAAMELDQWESSDASSGFDDGPKTSGTGSSSGGGEEDEDDDEEEEEESDDPEWRPKPVDKPERMPRKSKSSRGRGRHQEERRLRKKEQNKSAATRYRLKKKAEMKELLREEEELKRKKEKLEEKAADIRNKPFNVALTSEVLGKEKSSEMEEELLRTLLMNGIKPEPKKGVEGAPGKTGRKAPS